MSSSLLVISDNVTREWVLALPGREACSDEGCGEGSTAERDQDRVVKLPQIEG